jgi:hypothetical protein
MIPAFDLMDPEWLWTLLILAATVVGAIVEWRRGGSDVEALKVRMHVLEQTAATAQDWADLNIRISVNERLTEKLVREWEGAETDAED